MDASTRNGGRLVEEVKAKSAAFDAGQIPLPEFQAFMDRAEAQDTEIVTQQKTLEKAHQLRGAADSTPPPPWARNKAIGKTGRAAAPLAFDDESLKAMHQAIVSRQSLQVEAFSTVDSLLPSQLAPQVLGPVHETRLLERLPAQATSAPSYEFIRHLSTTGAPTVVAEGAAKPELVLVTDRVIAVAQKIAAHTATSWEALTDWDAWAGYVQGELFRQVIDVENAELLNGDGTTEHLTGLLHTSGILTHDASADTGTNLTALDSVEKSIAAMRTGAALAEPDLLVLNPLSWSALRRIKDTQGHSLASSDPTAGAANTLWGVDVLVTTQLAAGRRCPHRHHQVRQSACARGSLAAHRQRRFRLHAQPRPVRRGGTTFARCRPAGGAAVHHRAADVMMKVKVFGNYQVCHEGSVYRPGDTADVPDEVAKEWLASGWVTEAPARAKVVDPPKKAAPRKSTGARTK